MLFTSFITRRQEERKIDDMADDRRMQTRDLTPEQMLSKSKKNFQIKNTDILSIQGKKDLFAHYNLKFLLKTGEKTVKINFSVDKDRNKEIKTLLSKLYPTQFQG